MKRKVVFVLVFSVKAFLNESPLITDIFQRMTQRSSLLLLHYLLKSLTLFSTAAASQSEGNWALSGVIHLFFISFLPPAGSVALVFVIAPSCGVLNLSE